MKSPRLWFKIAAGEEFNESIIKGLSIRHSLDDCISFAEVTIEDASGHILSDFNITYGSPASITIVDFAGFTDELKPGCVKTK